jgi:hypothetical protein
VPSKRCPAIGIAALCAGLWLPGFAPDAAYADRREHAASTRQDSAHGAHRHSRADPHRGNHGTGARRHETRRFDEPKTAPAHRRGKPPSNAYRERSFAEQRPLHGRPSPHHIVVHRGAHFHYHHGAWYRGDGSRFIRVAAPIGAVVHVLPSHYWRVWFYGVPFPYYYAKDAYYVQSPHGYVVTAAPPQPVIEEEPVSGTDGGALVEEPVDGTSNQANADRLYAYPRQGQSAQQLEHDRSQCRQWAAGQTGNDPLAESASADALTDYQRALGACLEGRGYAVR